MKETEGKDVKQIYNKETKTSKDAGKPKGDKKKSNGGKK